jgi:anaerobic ribonucleoside-triphosphate reductase activating protein
MMIRVNKAHFPVTVLGPGRRLGIWLQGCSLHCYGCVSRDTWLADAGREIPVNALLAWGESVTRDHLDGVTISGGEPFDQPEALSVLLDGLATWRRDSSLAFDIMAYSGRPLHILETEHAALLAKLDAIISEPFLAHRAPGSIWRGSDNQQLLPLTPLGRDIYSPYQDMRADAGFQVAAAGGQIWFIGLPGREGMAPVEEACARHGIQLKGGSWRA